MKKQHKKQYKIVIGGYYGFGSLGDEAVLYSILSEISKKAPDAAVTVLWHGSSPIPKINGLRITSKSRANPLSVICAFFRADLFISGGGSLLQDSTSKRSLSYYCALLHMAKLFGCKIFVFANGLGPIKNEKKCRSALLLADKISLRDPNSLSLAKRLLGEKALLTLSADPIFAHPFSKIRCLPPSKFSFGKPYFAVSLRSCKSKNHDCINELLPAVIALSKKGYHPVFIPMQDCCDLEISTKMAQMTGGDVVRVEDADELYCLLEKASFAVGMRLHFLLICAICGTPLVALSYDPKVEGCLSALGIDTILPAFGFSSNELLSAIQKAKSTFSKSEIEAACRNLKRLSLEDFDTAFSLLSQKADDPAFGEKFFADT